MPLFGIRMDPQLAESRPTMARRATFGTTMRRPSRMTGISPRRRLIGEGPRDPEQLSGFSNGVDQALAGETL